MNLPEDLITKIKNLQTPAIIAISGFGGSGKSSIAKDLGKLLNASVIGVDSFQKPGAFDTEYKLWEIMDFSRLEKEVLQPFLNNEPNIKYGHFDPGQNIISEIREVENKEYLIIEGVGLFRTQLIKYFTFKIWIDVSLDIATTRGKKRDREYGGPTDQLWDGIWKNNELQYIKEFDPKSVADYIIKNN